MAEPLILAIDQSTSATKALLFNRSGRLVHRTDESHQQFYPRPGWVEHDPEEILVKTIKAIRRLVEESGVNAEDIQVLSITNQRETALIWDRQTGKPAHNAIVWQERRTAPLCAELRAAGAEDTIRAKTGLVIDPYFSASKLKWILDNVDGARGAAESGRLAAGTIDSWLIFKLTDGKVHATDCSNACRTMLLNIHEVQWDSELCEIFTMPMGILPEVKPSSARFGETTLGGILHRPIPIVGVMGDSHAACFGQNCFKSGMAKATYGTGSSIMMNIGERALDPPRGLVTSIGWGLGNTVFYVYEGNIHCTGDTVKWLVDGLELIPNSRSSEGIAATVEDNEGVYLVPAFVGLGAPYWDSAARASILGMSRGSKKAHVVRAALEAIAYQIRDLVDLMAKGAGVRLKELRVDGGPTRNGLLMQFQSDMLQVPVVRTEVEEVSALGVAFMGGLGTGLWKDLGEIEALRRVDAVFTAKMPSERRDKYYHGWQEAVRRTLSGADTAD
jgi:glycerol kinase